MTPLSDNPLVNVKYYVHIYMYRKSNSSFHIYFRKSHTRKCCNNTNA